MKTNDGSSRSNRWLRWLRGWRAPVIIGVLLLIVVFVWMGRVRTIVPFDESAKWDESHAPPRRQIVWGSAKEIGNLLPKQSSEAELITPRLSDNGATLYFSRRTDRGDIDIYLSRLVDGQWSIGVAVEELNTTADEIAPSHSGDGRHVYFYSNRDGGFGGHDIYTSERTPTGWTAPRNLGPQINTLAHEYDPAISPDGHALYFSSNRTLELHANSSAKNSDRKPWTTTLRARIGVSKFDLYIAKRDTTETPWSTAAAIESLNRSDSDEGAAFVSPNGVFLYFASDRRARSNETPNLDLYRARILASGVGEPENLGPSINTPAHETEPALSPEGFKLVFSSNRNGHDRLYVSQALEVYEDAEWRSAVPFNPIWWWSLLATILTAALIALVLRNRGKLQHLAWPARFFLGSVIMHLLVLLLLALWTLPKVIEMIIADMPTGEPATQLVDNNQHQSHEDGREAYEKVVDLKSVEKTSIQRTARTETEPLSLPERTEHQMPMIPAEVARQLPPRQVLYVAPRQTRPAETKSLPLQRRPIRPAAPEVELADLPQELLRQEIARPDKLTDQSSTKLARQPASTNSVERQRPNIERPQSTAVEPTELAKVENADQPATESARTAVQLQRSARDLPQDLPLEFSETPLIKSARVVAKTRLASTTTTVSRRDVSIFDPTSSQPNSTRLPPRRAAQPSNIKFDVTETQLSDQTLAGKAIEVPKSLRKTSLASAAGIALTEDQPTALKSIPKNSGELLVQTQINIDRTVPVLPKSGTGRTADLPRRSTQASSAATPIKFAALSSNELPTKTNSAVSGPPVRIARRSNEARRQLDLDVTDNLPVDTAESTELKRTDPLAISVARVLQRSKLPTKAPATALPSQVAVAKVKIVQQIEMKNDRTLGRPASTSTRLDRTVTQQARLTEVDFESLSTLNPTATPKEQSATSAKVNLARVNGEVPVFDVRTPIELTGPVTRLRQRIVVGELSNERNRVAPSFSPIASRLDRRRARASKVALAEDNVGMRSMFSLRQGDTRKQFIELFGGTNQSENVVSRGLVWLAQHQNQDGSWSLHDFHKNCKGKHPNCSGAGAEHSNCAATGMTLLPFLAAGHTHLSGEYKKTVSRAINWMTTTQKENGDLLANGDGQHMYSHGIATIALCEAYGMTQDSQLEKPARQAIDFIVKAQHKGSGGWRYKPNEKGDTSVVGWQMMAIKSGEMAGIEVPKATIDNVGRWLKSVEDKDGGRFGYTGRGASPAMTAEGLLCLQFMQIERNDPRMRRGADYLLQHLPQRSQKNTSYYWYYATQVMYHMQGQYWKTWNDQLRDQLVETQVTNGHMAGTWTPRDQWEKRGGRVYSTAMKLLMLEVYYRHLPLYQQLDD